MKYEALIIGGGPAGTMCGIKLQQAGIKTCIIERDKYPREKLCGGLLTQKTIDFLHKELPDLPTSDFVVNKVNSIDLYFQKEKAVTQQTDCYFYFTNRIVFDNLLAQYYKKTGGTLIDGTRLYSRHIDFVKKEISAEGQIYQYDYLISADGCNSAVTRAAKVKRHDSFCLETSCRPSQFNASDFRLYFSYPKNAYAWYFPKNGFYTVGLGGINQNKDLKSIADIFFAKVGENMAKMRGAFIPSGHRLRYDWLPENVLLVGDAGGFIDPITGEGIYYALRTGALAAMSIVEARNTADVQKNYYKKIVDIQKNIKYGIYWHDFLYSPRVWAWFIRSAEKHVGFVRFYLEKVISTYEYNYKNFVWVYFRKYRKIYRKK